MTAGYWNSPWPAEDGGPTRQQCAASLVLGEPEVTSRLSIASTMVVRRNVNEWFLLCHTGGDDAVSWVERFDPETLEVLGRSIDLPAGPTWPGGLAVHRNGDIYVVFGRYAHRLTIDLEVVAAIELPRNRPYNSFVVLDDGTLVTKDFGGSRPGEDTTWEASDCELVALSPELQILDRHILPEGSVARLSAEHSDVFVVGVQSFFVVGWDGHRLAPTQQFPYRENGEGFGWDAVIGDGRAWFLNNGAGSQNFDGSLRGKGVASAPQAVIAVDFVDGVVEKYIVNEQPGSLVANPPAIDVERKIAVGYDSGNGVVTAFRYDVAGAEVLWTKAMWHACHPMVMSDAGYVVMNDFNFDLNRDEVVVLDIETGRELSRAATESPLQSVLFGAPGDTNDVYLCSFTHLTRVAWSRPSLGY